MAKKQTFISTIIFGIVFWFCNKSPWFEQTFGDAFKIKKSYLQEMEGDLYGICEPMEHLRELNAKIVPTLSKLMETPFFNHYKVNMERECPFWAQQRMCNNEQCAVCECPPE